MRTAHDIGSALGLKFNPTRAIDFCDVSKVSHDVLLLLLKKNRSGRLLLFAVRLRA
jgi:hypothetical protein